MIKLETNGFSRPVRKAHAVSVGFFFMSFFVYILQSEQDGSYYIGYSEDPEKRIEDHNSGRARYTRHKIPWKLVYQEKFNTKTEALKRERFLKKQRNREFYFKLISKK
jgi:putative endonuclease